MAEHLIQILFIVAAIFAVGETVFAVEKEGALQKESKWIRLPIPIPRRTTTAATTTTQATASQNCPTITGCTTTSGGACGAGAGSDRCDDQGTPVTCYWPTAANNCMKDTATPDCICDNQ